MTIKQFAIKVKPCSDEEKEECIVYNRTGKCNLSRCHYATKYNPTCFKKTMCNNYNIVKVKDDTYIVYNCRQSCKYHTKLTEKLLKTLKMDDIIYGEELKDLLKESKDSVSSSSSDVEILTNILRSVVDSL